MKRTYTFTIEAGAEIVHDKILVQLQQTIGAACGHWGGTIPSILIDGKDLFTAEYLAAKARLDADELEGRRARARPKSRLVG